MAKFIIYGKSDCPYCIRVVTKLAKAKPGLIQPRINKGTKEVFDAIENASREVENADAN